MTAARILSRFSLNLDFETGTIRGLVQVTLDSSGELLSERIC